MANKNNKTIEMLLKIVWDLYPGLAIVSEIILRTNVTEKIFDTYQRWEKNSLNLMSGKNSLTY
jgi:hypothetical protein